MIDYYAMLGLDARADRAQIESALNRLQPEWASKALLPGQGNRYARILEQLPGLRQSLLGTPQQRAAYDARLAAARSRALDDLQRLVRLRAAKGGLTVSDRHFLRGEAEQSGLSIGDVDRMMEVFAPWPEPPAEPDDSAPNPIDPLSWARLADVLSRFGKANLYELLGLPHDTPDVEIAERLAVLRNAVGSEATPEDAAQWAAAVGMAHAHLGTPDARARYDRALEAAAEAEFRTVVQKTVHGQRRVAPETWAALLVEAAGLGLSQPRAEACVRRVCRELGGALEVMVVGGDLIESQRRWLRCRHCNGLTQFGWAEIHSGGQCRFCHASLRWQCPVCKRGSWVDERRCACGFPVEFVEPLRQHFEAAQAAFRMRHHVAALNHLRAVQRYAPNHVGARKGIEKLQKQIADVRRTRAAFQEQRAARRLVAARAALEQWERLVAPTDARLKSALEQLSAELTRALRLTSEADQLARSDATAARQRYREALSIASDLPEALDGLRRCPPDGPTELFAEVGGGRVRLRWTPPAPDGYGPVAFVVLRKEGAAPTHPDDGEVVAEVAHATWEDPNAGPGDVFGYAVFAVREGVWSLFGVSSGPFVVTEDVRAARIEARSGEIALSWELPPRAIGALVVRKVGSPVKGPRHGVVVESTSDHATDSGLADGRVVHYGIFAIYPGPDGRRQASRGIYLSAIPGPQPEPVSDLRLDAEPDGRLWMLWTPPAHGRVRLFRGTRPASWKFGALLSLAELEGAEGSWIEPMSAGRASEVLRAGAPAGLIGYTALTVTGSSAAVGASATWADLSDPTRLRAVRAGADFGRLVVRWTWPEGPGTQAALVVARAGRYPTGPTDPDARSLYIDKFSYERQRYVELPLGEPRDAAWHVVVYSALEAAGTRWHSPGTEPTARCVVPPPGSEVTVLYELRPPKLGQRKWTIQFATEPAGTAFGATVLVARPGLLPLDATDGKQVARFAPAHDGQVVVFEPPVRLEGRRLRLLPDASALADRALPAIALCVRRGR